jgi:hypothetical protein
MVVRACLVKIPSSMNLSLWLGVLFGAASLLCLYLANQKSNQDTNRTVATEVNKVLERIDAVQKTVASSSATGITTSPSVSAPSANAASRRDAQQQLDDIDRNFSHWVSNFIKSRDLKKITLQNQQLEARATELELSKQYRPIFQRIVDGIRAAITAYNATTGTDFKAHLKDLPSNLYVSAPDEREFGTVVFATDVAWTVRFYSEKPARADRLPYFQIDIRSGSASVEDQLRVYLNPPDLTIGTFGGGVVSAAKLSEKYPIASANQSTETIVQQLIETQISSLPNQ